MKTLMLIIFLSLAAMGNIHAQRITRTINESWTFIKDGKSEVVNIPHTWNVEDCYDDVPGYYRGLCTYRKCVKINESIEDSQFYLHFEGVGQVAQVYVNGHLAGTHTGGYSAFCFDISPYVKQGDNDVCVTVDNSHNPDIPPLSADFTFFGGIYRDVSLVVTAKTHISTTHYATSGVYISTPEVNARQAGVSIRTHLTNALPDQRVVKLTHRVADPDGKIVKVLSRKVKIKENVKDHIETIDGIIDSPQLWSTEDPNLYVVYTTIEDKDGNVLDKVANRIGLRWFKYDKDSGFFLNGKHCKLVGTNRHQCLDRKGNATPDEIHVSDIVSLKEMGGNFLRISHYPQDPMVTQLCDRLGIVTTVEIPIVNEITVSETFLDNCRTMILEMIHQDYNSPSVTAWAYMNEVLLNLPYSKKQPDERKAYLEKVYEYAVNLENLIKETDCSRYTMIPFHSDMNRYDECGLTKIPDILGWNLYKGWYGDTAENFAPLLDLLHSRYPDKVLMVTEYGADMDARLHSLSPERFDFSCEYGMYYHKTYLPAMLQRDFIAASAVWNLNDFYSESRTDGVPHINNKGLSDIDREHKDVYYYYQANLLQVPYLHIGGQHWRNRGGVTSDGLCRQRLEVYTNLPEVSLVMNGKPLESVKTEGGIAAFDVDFVDGENVISARGYKDGNLVEDMAKVRFTGYPETIGKDFKDLNILCGTKRFFDDRDGHLAWIPEKEYSEGSWGYIGGRAFYPKTSRGTVPCIHTDIIGTTNDPLWQTQRRDLEAFKADVPDGQYSIYLYFSEWDSKKKKEALIYNLGGGIISETASDRIFDVCINGETVLKQFDIAEEAGAEQAVVKKFIVTVTEGQGLEINFKPIKGSPILNAVRIWKAF